MCLEKLSKYQGWDLLILRVFVGLVFVLAGWPKLTNIAGAEGMLSGAGFPLAAVFAWIVAIVEFVGGLALILGFFVRWAALLTGIVALVATLSHWTGILGPGAAGWNAGRTTFVLLAGLIVLLVRGGGNWSLQSLFSK